MAKFEAIDAPPNGCFLPSASDSADLAHVTTGISFSTTGAFKVTMENGDVVTIPSGSLAAGVIHRMRIKRLWSTGMGLANPVCYYNT